LWGFFLFKQVINHCTYIILSPFSLLFGVNTQSQFPQHINTSEKLLLLYPYSKKTALLSVFFHIYKFGLYDKNVLKILVTI